jgi:methionyl-tRNA formyltransferase
VRALVVPGPATRLRTVPARTILAPGGAVARARAGGVPVAEIERPRAATPWPDIVPRPDVLLTACFPWRVPAAWRAAAGLAALNVHPSLLPAYRGPAPLFWQMRDAEARTGVTVHHLDHGLDTGDIVLAEPVALGAREGAAAAEARLLRVGAARLGCLLRDGARLDRVPQAAAGASYQGWPDDAACAMDGGWTLARAASFLRVAGDWGPLRFETAAGPVEAHGLESVAPGARLGAPWREESDGIAAVQLADGVLRVRRARRATMG